MKRTALFLALIVAILTLTPPASIGAQGQAGNPCPLTVRMTAATSSANLVVGNGTNAIRVCFYSLSLGLAATTTAQLVWGTGTTCGTSTVSLSPKIALAATVTAIGNVSTFGGDGSSFIDENPSRGVSNLCLNVSGSSPSVDGIVRYGLY